MLGKENSAAKYYEEANGANHSSGDEAWRTEHGRFMDAALDEAVLALQENEVPVGCVLVVDGAIVARAHNLTNARNDPLCHAEYLVALEYFGSAGQSGSGSASGQDGHATGLPPANAQDHCSPTFYITVEPCVMCHGILKRIGVTVYFGCLNEIFGTKKLTGADAGVHLHDPRAIKVLQQFYARENVFAPETKRINKK